MKGCLQLLVEDEMGFYEVTLPKNQVALFSSTKNLAIWELVVARDIGHFEGTKLGDFALKLETCESLCHFPELDMSEA